MQALAIMYHDVVENGDFESSGFSGVAAHVYKLRREDFERHLDAIVRATARVSTIRELEGRPVLLTFDDGGVSFHHPIADLLESRGWRGHFFITTDPIGTPGFLTEPQCGELPTAAATSSAAIPARIPPAWRRCPAPTWTASGAKVSPDSPRCSANP